MLDQGFARDQLNRPTRHNLRLVVSGGDLRKYIDRVQHQKATDNDQYYG